jgi:hypothetical protein
MKVICNKKLQIVDIIKISGKNPDLSNGSTEIARPDLNYKQGNQRWQVPAAQRAKKKQLNEIFNINAFHSKHCFQFKHISNASKTLTKNFNQAQMY